MDQAPPPKHELEVRAEAGTLTNEDYQLIRRAQALQVGMRAGKTVAQIAQEDGNISRSALSRYLDSAKYHAALRAASIVPAERRLNEEQAIEAARKSLANQLPDAVTFIEKCFERELEKPGQPYKDPGNAQWATALLLKAAGIGERTAADNRQPIMITAEAMQVMLGAIKADDGKRETRALPAPTATAFVDKETLN